uniref:nucleoporin NUP188-like isoform X2 n=2 Tax=Myxine glutinosa TaxID=7769 RepID=UPI00358ECFC5
MDRSSFAAKHHPWKDLWVNVAPMPNRKEFWEDITFTLFKDFQPFTKELDMNILQACAFILKIVSLEIYYMQRPCTELRTVLNRLFAQHRYEHWSMYMRDMAKGVASLECAGEIVPEEVALFTAAWRTFLMLATTHGEALCLSQPKQRRAMLADILEALQALASDGTGLSSLKLLPILTTSFLVLLHSWGEFIPPSDEILPTLLTILEGLSDREISWLDRTHARLIAATTLVLTSAPLPGLDLPCLPALLRLACSVAQRHVSRLQHELRGLGPSSSAKASKDDSDEAMETEHHANPTPDDPTGVCVASLRLVQAICNVQSDGEEARSRGLGVVRDSGLLHSLLGALECALAHRVQLNFSLSALDLFLTVAASSQVTKHFSFPVSTAGM